MIKSILKAKIPNSNENQGVRRWEYCIENFMDETCHLYIMNMREKVMEMR